MRRLWSGGGSRGCIVIAKFCRESLHFLHTDVIGSTQFQFMYGGGWVQVDVVGEGAGFKSEGHALKYHFLVEVWCAKGNLTESINECPKCLVLFLSDTEE